MGGDEEAGVSELGQAVDGPVGDGQGVFGIGAAEELVKDGETAAGLPGL
jgi:hypothetical protein